MGRRITGPRATTAFATVDLDKPGKQTGFVMIPHSPHEDAWGVTRIPIGVIANGASGRVTQVTVNIQTPDVESFRRSEAQVAAALARAVSRGRRGL